MNRYCDNKIILKPEIEDLGDCQAFYATVSQPASGTMITKTGTDLDVDAEAGTVTFWISQDESVDFLPSNGKQNSALVQLRFIDADGKRKATRMRMVGVDDVLYEELL